MSTKQRMISAKDLAFPGYLRAPDVAKPTAMGLWLHTDVDGRRELIPELIAGDLYPGRAAVDLIVEHLLMLDESGFLTIYQAAGSEWIELAQPLKADRRGAVSDCPPPPPRGGTWKSMAVGGARERARERVLGEGAERAGAWSGWEQEQERARMPARPLLLDAPPIGCPEHPNGRFADCGQCGTARRRHDRWVAQQRYEDAVADYERSQVGDDEPF